MRVNEESEKSGLKLNMQKPKIMTSSSVTSWQIEEGKSGNWKILFSWSPKSLPIVTAAMKLKKTKTKTKTKQNQHLLLGRKTDTPKQHIKKQRYYFARRGPYHQAMAFPIVMYKFKLAYKEDWVMKNWCFQTMVLEKTLVPPLDSKKIKPVKI